MFPPFRGESLRYVAIFVNCSCLNIEVEQPLQVVSDEQEKRSSANKKDHKEDIASTLLATPIAAFPNKIWVDGEAQVVCKARILHAFIAKH